MASTKVLPAGGSTNTTTQFTTIKDLFEQIDRTTGDVLTVQGVSPKDFTEIEKEREARRRKFRFRRYQAESEILIIAIPTAAHEQLHHYLNIRIIIGIAGMGLEHDWRSSGSTTFRPRGHPGGDGGEGDSSGCPISQRPGGQDWPTLVIEAGYSQSLEGLRADMQWWFSASNHQVKIVLLVKLDQSRGEIILEKWQEVSAPPPPRQGPITRAAAAATQLQPSRDQLIAITRAPGITNTHPNRFNPTSYIVTSGALRLEFEHLFLRPPGPGEADIIISMLQLQKFAENVWRVV
ncbi:hypothetical protein QBC46DRAFT_125929 [Diplogelasinospora grovesii]|uniref:Uncharacterized protein n=1 Tax=Diplogelasinospora grovesii TaxID=303347 RepID=A0AAN6S574_9PEZI|nr:hypothetical protein QBC46DRAFT_125929 [Diplogelasinospora grovesii]